MCFHAASAHQAFILHLCPSHHAQRDSHRHHLQLPVQVSKEATWLQLHPESLAGVPASHTWSMHRAGYAEGPLLQGT